MYEKTTKRLQEKLEKLAEEIEKNPPETIIGKKLMNLKLNLLKNMIDRRILINNARISEQLGEFSSYKEYAGEQDRLMSTISSLEYKKMNLLKRLENLEKIIPGGKNSIFEENKKRLNKNMPKGYRDDSEVSQDKSEESQDNPQVTAEINSLKKELEGIEKELEEKNAALETSHGEYERAIKEKKAELKKDLAVIKPKLFERIKKFFNEKINQFKEWRQQRIEEADKNLKGAMDEAKETSGKNGLREELAKQMEENPNMTLEAQARFAKEAVAKQQQKQQQERSNDQKTTGEDVKVPGGD